MDPVRGNHTLGTGDECMKSKKNTASSGRIAYRVIAKVNIPPMRHLLGKHKDFVCFPVRPVNNCSNGTPEFRIFDHRMETVRAANLPVPSGGDLYLIEGLGTGAAAHRERMRRRPVVEVANSVPAKVVVIEKRDSSGRLISSHINLFHAEGEAPTGLLSVHSYTRRRGVGCTEHHNPFWSKVLTQRLRNKTEEVLISLTNEDSQIVIVGPTSREITIIGSSIRTERRGKNLAAMIDSDDMAW